MDEGLIFEDYNVRFTDEELRQADKDTLEKCKKRLQEVLIKLNN